MKFKAQEAALTERLEQVGKEQAERLRADREALVKKHGADHPQVKQVEQQLARFTGAKDNLAAGHGDTKSEALIDSITHSLEAIEAMRVDLQKKFEEDLDATNARRSTSLKNRRSKVASIANGRCSCRWWIS